MIFLRCMRCSHGCLFMLGFRHIAVYIDIVYSMTKVSTRSELPIVTSAPNCHASSTAGGVISESRFKTDMI